MEENGTIVFTNLISLPNVLDSLDNDVILHIVSDNARITGVVEQSQSGIDGSANEDRLGTLCTCLGHHLKLSNLMGIELEQLKEVHQQCSNVDLILCQLVRWRSEEVSLTLKTSEQEHSEHGAVEDVTNLSLIMMIYEIEIVLVVPRNIGVLLFLSLTTCLIMASKQMFVVKEPPQRFLSDGPDNKWFIKAQF